VTAESKCQSEIGIDHISVSIPNRVINAETLAANRRVAPEKLTEGIGIKQMAVAAPTEDVVALAANAGFRVLQEAGVSPLDVGLLIVGTESAEDKAKPTATHVHELLGVGTACRVYDIVHACAGATYGVVSAIDWLRDPTKRYALVIASDIARYDRGSAGEPTQGAGAVAMLLCRNPRLMNLLEIAAYSRHVYDFWKPMKSDYPFVKGAFSAKCYMDAAEACFTGLDLSEESAFVYHAPYPKLVHQVHRMVSERMKGGREGRHLQWVFDSLAYASRIGNIYTGSLWLALVSLLESLLGEPDCRLPRCCYLFSYGSGCGALLLKGSLQAEWARMTEKIQLAHRLGRRREISIEEYEALNYGSAQESRPPESGDPFSFRGIHNDERKYGSDGGRRTG
jgi:hydroxymethylglutaryl-CoA synthase